MGYETPPREESLAAGVAIVRERILEAVRPAAAVRGTERRRGTEEARDRRAAMLNKTGVKKELKWVMTQRKKKKKAVCEMGEVIKDI